MSDAKSREPFFEPDPDPVLVTEFRLACTHASSAVSSKEGIVSAGFMR